MASPGNEYLASYIDRAMAAINPDTAGEYCERS
jgi:hypothetical protein